MSHFPSSSGESCSLLDLIAKLRVRETRKTATCVSAESISLAHNYKEGIDYGVHRPFSLITMQVKGTAAE